MSLVAHQFERVKHQILNIFFDFFFTLLPVGNNNEYSKFDISKSMSYKGHNSRNAFKKVI